MNHKLYFKNLEKIPVKYFTDSNGLYTYKIYADYMKYKRLPEQDLLEDIIALTSSCIRAIVVAVKKLLNFISKNEAK